MKFFLKILYYPNKKKKGSIEHLLIPKSTVTSFIREVELLSIKIDERSHSKGVDKMEQVEVILLAHGKMLGGLRDH